MANSNGLLNVNSLTSLHRLSRASVCGKLDESVSYGILTEAIIQHKVVLGLDSFIIFPQLRLPWKPSVNDDRRLNIPDIGFGRLLPDGRLHLQGGAEMKVAVEAMRNIPPADDPMLLNDKDFRHKMNNAYLQATDQVKAAVKNGAFPQGIAIWWIVAVGPYFSIRHFGPFTHDNLDTRGHRLNMSGEYNLSSFLRQMQDTVTTRPVIGPVYLIGTPEAAQVLHHYLQSGLQLYLSTDRLNV